ncbi:MAG: universal stress protein [Candidatus Dormiibacterota bacterium]
MNDVTSTNDAAARSTVKPRRLLIAVHDSIAAHAAVPVAATIARALRAKVVVVTVVESAAGPLDQPIQDRDLNAANTLLEVLRAEGLSASLDVRVAEDGDVAKAVVASTEQLAPELLVLGSHSQHEVVGLVGGSVLYDVIRRAVCPVLVVPILGAQFHSMTMLTRIVLAVHVSDTSDHAASVVMRLAEPGAEVFVLHVHEVDLPDQEGLSERVNSIVRMLESAGLQPRALESHTLPHAIPETILDISARMEAGLIVLGNPGRSELGGLLHGSVSHKLLRNAHCPVLIVR